MAFSMDKDSGGSIGEYILPKPCINLASQFFFKKKIIGQLPKAWKVFVIRRLGRAAEWDWESLVNGPA